MAERLKGDFRERLKGDFRERLKGDFRERGLRERLKRDL